MPIAATSTSNNYDVKKNYIHIWIVLLNIWNASYRVNLVLNGHVHAYERSRPVYQDKVDKKGIVYVVVGDAASKPGDHDAIYMDPVCKDYKNAYDNSVDFVSACHYDDNNTCSNSIAYS